MSGPCSRLPRLLRYGLVSAGLGACLPAVSAAETIVGVAAPLSGSSSLLGEQVVRGARSAAQGDTTVTTADTRCSADGGRDAAERFVASGARVVVGFLCTEALQAALPVLTQADIPVLAVGVRTSRITEAREKTGYKVWRIAPRSDAEARAIADTMIARWRAEPFGLVEDGSIANRGLTDTVRRLLADEGLEPAATDNYRPAEEKQFGLARRLMRTGVTRFFMAGDRSDIAVIARDAAELGLGLEIIGGESLVDEASPDQPLAEGVTAVAPPLRHAAPAADGSAAQDLRGYAGPAHAAMQIAQAAVSTLAGSTIEERSLADILNEATFETLLGPVDFDANGDSDAVRYRALRWNGEAFVPEAGEDAAPQEPPE
ncbi:branched-chain amino acid ABC transporter substrate-binding protein [Fulvimarina sp. 2208YS6-2-32]|uniref:Branched-chain amino acid ABC transporter substrate-binding protein n=1 Tax=Fulvimarina uroteuthidis TaxID=3098149 RepID=A0ABU5I2K3_9HYPH|nr:branched-chain amino acid ABC transporter substrate-binding protein [Fulvimarina sp. 2208YS6-2-32]MDY8108396.1 branched-chain amino acid ABC transporter substrate-binding protein [Fulvimarina sp. 2208YS6-2-32]